MGVSGTDGSSGTLPAPSPEPPPFAIPPLPVPPEFEPPDAPLDAASPPDPLEPSDGSPSPASPPIVPAGVLMPLKEAPPKGLFDVDASLPAFPSCLVSSPASLDESPSDPPEPFDPIEALSQPVATA